MKTIKGDLKLCCTTTAEFRDKVAVVARQRGTKVKDFVLEAVRDRVTGGATTLASRRSIALENLLKNKRESAKLKHFIEECLAPYMPKP